MRGRKNDVRIAWLVFYKRTTIEGADDFRILNEVRLGSGELDFQ